RTCCVRLHERQIMETSDLTLELSADEMQRLVAQAMERIIPHVTSLPQQPSVDVEGATEMARTLKEPLPERGQPVNELLDLLFQRTIPKSFNTAGPGYLAYLPCAGLFHSAVAALLTAGGNC